MIEFMKRISKLSPKRLALLAMDLKKRVDLAEAAQSAPIAVIGIGCRFPGGVRNPRDFWRLLRDGIDAIGEVPADRWDIDAYFDPNPEAPGKMNTRFGGFIEDVEKFDPHFFGIAPREAMSMDPQQRLLLEVGWEALENAGIAPESQLESSTGVFVGISSHDYFQYRMAGNPAAFDAYSASGSSHAITSGRLSYFLGTRGPSLAVDTACSSSLVSVHLACQSLRSGECDMALAGGVNLILGPDTTIMLSKSGMMATDGRCKTFDAAADGFVRGEGCGIVVLKPLQKALSDGDPILALIEGIALNQDGRSNGLTAPNGPSQVDVIRAALKNAGIDPADVGFVETHGTGTSLGDPIEVQALAAVFGEGRHPQNPLMIGSLKTNIGHLESSAGVAGLIKAILVLQNKEVPPHLHFRKPNPHINWDDLPFIVPTARTSWTSENGKRVAGVSSFGFSGTNVHLLLREAPERQVEGVEEKSIERPLHILTLSAKSSKALEASARQYLKELSSGSLPALKDVCCTANTGRSHFQSRLAVAAASQGELIEKLQEFMAGRKATGLHKNDVKRKKSPEVVFLFTGQGSQYIGMGRQLYDTQPVFRKALKRCDEILQPYLGQPLAEILYPEKGISPLDKTAFTQPLLFALEWSLAQMWQSWGVTPSAVMGHSLGEYVAACVAGVFSLEDGLRLVAERGRLIQELPDGGGMAALFADGERVQKAIELHHHQVSIAAYNTPDVVVISGDREIVDGICDELAAEDIGSRQLIVSHAFHSSLMDPMLKAFEEAAQEISYLSPRIPLVSNVNGEAVAAGVVPGAQHWRNHLRKPVQFRTGIETLYDRGYRIFLEIGPAPTLSGLGRQCIPGEDAIWLPSLRPGREDWDQLLDSLGILYTNGVPVDWQGFDSPYGRHKVVLPTYPFQRESFWVERVETPSRVHGGRPGKVSKSSVRPFPEREADGPPAVFENVMDSDMLREEIGNWLYEVQWPCKERVSWSKDFAASSSFAGLSEISDTLENEVDRLVKEHDLSIYDEMLPRLDDLCMLYILKAFRELGWQPRAGVRLTKEALMAELAIQDIHALLIDRILEMLQEDGYLRRIESEWLICKVPVFADPQQRLMTLLAQFPQCSPEISMVGQCGKHLADVLKGRRDPLELLFPGGSLESAEKLYQETPSNRVFNTLIQQAISEAVKRLPPGQPVRILELGAGTGGTTSYVLPAVSPSRVEYVFTDVSQMFTAKAEKKFAACNNVTYRLLDISRDPGVQGFPLHHYDLILAANVLHATRDIGRTLENILSLLTSKGLLIVLEATRKTRMGDLTVGLTEGWWHFEDTDLRPSYALLSHSQWLDVLVSKGFVEAMTIPREKREPAALSVQTVLLAQGPSLIHDEKEKKIDRPWLVFSDSTGVGENLITLFREKKNPCFVVKCGERLRQIDEYSWEINPEKKDYSMLLEEVIAKKSAPLQGIIYLWGLDAEDPEAVSPEHLEKIQERTCGSVLSLVQALAKAGGEVSSAELWLVTQGVQMVGESPISLAVLQSPLWGLGKVIALEHPELSCVRVDLDPESKQARELFEELLFHDGEEEIVFRNGRRHAARLRQSTAGSSGGGSVSLTEQACYLITGGLSGLGLLAARWMVANGARNLVLVGRSAPSPSSLKILSQLEGAGAKVVVAQTDVSRSDQMTTLFADIKTTLPPLKGVVHCAGILDDGVLLQQTWKRFSRVMAPKVRGSWLLHTLTMDMNLDFFVLFSSGASMLGSSGQSNHAAANAFLDALSHYRHVKGLPSQSINWGAWSGIGSLVKHNITERIETGGMDTISPDRGMQVYEYLFHRIIPQIGVFPLDWPRFVAQSLHGNVPLFYSELASAQQSNRRVNPSGGDATQILNLLEATPVGRRSNLLCDWVKGHARKVLGLDPSGTIDIQQPLRELGLDSLMAVELRNALGRGIDRTLPATLLFDCPTIEEVTEYLAGDVLFLDSESGASDGNRQKTEQRMTLNKGELDELSADDIAALLEEKLN